jgi:hypothetical protein
VIIKLIYIRIHIFDPDSSVLAGVFLFVISPDEFLCVTTGSGDIKLQINRSLGSVRSGPTQTMKPDLVWFSYCI